MKIIQWPDNHPSSPPSTGFVVVPEAGEDLCKSDIQFLAELRDLGLGLRAPAHISCDAKANGRVSMTDLTVFMSELADRDPEQAKQLLMNAFATHTPSAQQLRFSYYIRFYHW